jgi:flagellar assembly protein FliH
MASLIRASTLNPQPRKLPQRPVAAAAPAITASAVAPPAPVPAAAAAVDAQARAAWQQQAERELAAARRQAEQEGHAAGHAKALADAQATYRDRVEHLNRLIDNAGRSFAAQIEGLEDIAVGIAFEALVKLLGEALATRAGVQAAVAQVLRRTKDEEKLVVHLSPNDFYLLLQQGAQSQALERPGIELVPDERIELGGCLVETGAGTLDGRIEAQLDVLRQTLLRVRRNGRSEGRAG